jgi:hypothetical protein
VWYIVRTILRENICIDKCYHPSAFQNTIERIQNSNVANGLVLLWNVVFFLSEKPNSRVSENEVLWKIPASKKAEVMDWGLKGRALTQAVRCHPFTAETRVRARVNLCGICGGQSGTGTNLSLGSSVFPSRYHFTVSLRTHIWSGGWTIVPLAATVQRRSLTLSTWTTTTTTGDFKTGCYITRSLKIYTLQVLLLL